MPPVLPWSGRWADAWANDQPTGAERWTPPTRVPVGGDWWGDSPWISPNGQTLYFMYYPGDPLTPPVTEQADVHVSYWPFESHEPVTIYDLSQPVYGAAGPMIDDDGGFWFMSNRDYANDGNIDTDIYRDGVRLAFNSQVLWYGNPHYCVETEELWFANSRAFRGRAGSARSTGASRPR